MSEREALALLAETGAQTDAHLAVVATRLAAELPAPLGRAVAYALGTRGKRVRPALVVGCYRACGGAAPAISEIAAAVEVVHTYSLVHDDLPCMDNDAQRRGRPTTHVVFDTRTATAVGWILVPVAIELLAAGAARLGLPAPALGRMATALLEAGGLRGMIGGQWLDLMAEGTDTNAEAVIAIHRGKTGSLMEACCRLGGIAAGAAASVLDALGAYGREVGLAFQIMDDVLDATATSAQLGKTAGRDAALAKSTFVRLLGIEGAQAAATRHAEAAVAALETAGLDGGALEGLARYIVTRTS
jgi:geranylgeranyl pyrophosphate synthase